MDIRVEYFFFLFSFRQRLPSILLLALGRLTLCSTLLLETDFFSCKLIGRCKFADALVLYNSILEKEPQNVEAHVGKGICLQSQNCPREAFESFANALQLDSQNACALTHCGVLYKEEGALLEAAEVMSLSMESLSLPVLRNRLGNVIDCMMNGYND